MWFITTSDVLQAVGGDSAPVIDCTGCYFVPTDPSWARTLTSLRYKRVQPRGALPGANVVRRLEERVSRRWWWSRDFRPRRFD